MSEHIFHSESEEDTERFAAALAERTPFGRVIALRGDLGAGKTAFARGFARGLGVRDAVSSPTFTLIKEYPLRDGNAFYHLDLYRIDNSDAALTFGVDEYLFAAHALTVIEWAERVEDLLPEDAVRVTIERTGEYSRVLKSASPCFAEALCHA